MANDDFSALDLLSAGGFKLYASLEKPQKRKRKKFRGKSNAAAKRRFSELLPLLGRALRRPSPQRSLQGWPVQLSWPTREIAALDLLQDHGNRPLS